MELKKSSWPQLIRFVWVSLFIFTLSGFTLITFSFKRLIYSVEFNLRTLLIRDMSLGFSLDWVRKLFLVLVLTIAARVFFYCWSYINSETNIWRFTFLVVVFVSRIIILITGSSLRSLILGWDGLGLRSYYLVIYYQNFKSNLSGFITVVSNRIGDVFIILFILIVLLSGLSRFWDKEVYDFTHYSTISIVILLRAITKRALFPYCTWLPEAIAAPTPVSSLVHSSTLVTAGIYILLRYASALTVETLFIFSTISAFTLVISSAAAVFCQDFKKVIALSTLRQLAFMGVVLSIGIPTLAFFHLITHAIFKSCLFIGAGSLLHLAQSNQDIRWRTNYKLSWGNTAVIIIPIISLVALPFTSGYFSKELILLAGLSGPHTMGLVVVLLVGAIFTVVYRLRLINNLSLSRSSTKIISIFEDFGRLISVIGVILLSLLGGWYLNQSGFDWFTLGSRWVVLFLQSAFVGFVILWVRYVFVFKRRNSPFWSRFAFLAPFSSTEVGRTINIGRAVIYAWEAGWVEALGPTYLQKISQDFTRGVYLLSLLNYKTLLGLFAAALVRTSLIV